MFFKGQRPYYIVVGLIPGLINKKVLIPVRIRTYAKLSNRLVLSKYFAEYFITLALALALAFILKLIYILYRILIRFIRCLTHTTGNLRSTPWFYDSARYGQAILMRKSCIEANNLAICLLTKLQEIDY